MVKDGYQAYHSDNPTIYVNIKSLCHTLSVCHTPIVSQLYFKKKK